MSKTLFRFSSFSKKHERSNNIINEFADEIIDKKTAELEIGKKTEMNDYEHKKPKSVVEILLENHSLMSREQMRNELVTVMIGKYSNFYIEFKQAKVNR